MSTLQEYEKALTKTNNKIRTYRESIIETLANQRGSRINGGLIELVKDAMDSMEILGSNQCFYEIKIKRLKECK